MFADTYLKKNKHRPLVHIAPRPDCGIIIVIPCHQEPDILLTLNSLLACNMPECGVEVLVLINHSEIASAETKHYNFNTKAAVDAWIANHPASFIHFHASAPVELPKKWAGVGLARKRGMDEAALRFSQLNRPEGIIVGLDADSLVATNYLVEIERHFQQNAKDAGTTIAFRHQTQGAEPRLAEGIRLYEQYLHYYKQALAYTGFPHAMFTVGSAFAVTAMAYVKRGGMNRRKAGEDFYFLQNLVQIGHVGEIRSTQVFPSPRISTRVPFGTGALMNKWMNGEDDLTKTYNFEAFRDLKQFFDRVESYFQMDETTFQQGLAKMPQLVREFVVQDNFWKEVNDLNNNCATLNTFKIRFFYQFNAFKILKFMNFAHERFYEKAALDVQIGKLKAAGKKQ